ncbi:MAG: tRNA (adenosine(37)-N6)-threonylcarbamoyltransferase complex dimerization subunit type 1 TsaB [Bacilli bacterium]
MKTLYIDSHNDIDIVLFEDGVVLRHQEVLDKKKNSTYLFPTIKEVLNGEVIDSIIVVNGPGSFTGVRLGVTIAKTLAYTLNIPIKTVSSLLCRKLSSKEENFAISDGNGYFLGIFNSDNTLKEDYKYLSNKDFLEYTKTNKVETNVTLDYESIYNYCLSEKSINPHIVNPIYIKKIGVEE